MMELLVGARDDRRAQDLRRLLMRFELLPFDVATDFEGAVHIYRRCRTAGFTPRGTVDCMIAAVAARTNASLLATDVAIHRIAQVVGIELDGMSPGRL